MFNYETLVALAEEKNVEIHDILPHQNGKVNLLKDDECLLIREMGWKILPIKLVHKINLNMSSCIEEN